MRTGLLVLLFTFLAAASQFGSVKFDKTVHDFGDVSVTDGPLSCTFTMTNTGNEPVTILEVAATCGCTGVTWKREAIQPGETASINATYKNQDGPTPFDKTLTVYISGIKRPVILRLRGVVHEKKKSLSQLYGKHRLGDFGFKALEYKTETLLQGNSVSTVVKAANLGEKPSSLSFISENEELSVSVTPNPVPAGGVATIVFTVTSSPLLYGWNTYTAVPVTGGRKAESGIGIRCFTRENFAGKDSDSAPQPVFTTSTWDFGKVAAGKTVRGSFRIGNEGNAPLKIYKADSESSSLKIELGGDIGPGESGRLDFELETAELARGENVIMITLTTNAPSRPVINLFVAGVIF